MKLTAVGVTAAVLSAVLKRNTPELAMLLALCAGLWMLALAAEGLGAAMALMRELAGQEENLWTLAEDAPWLVTVHESGPFSEPPAPTARESVSAPSGTVLPVNREALDFV